MTATPRPEYLRMQFRREEGSWINLNGGGFLQVVLKKGVTKEQVAERLHEVFMDSLVDVADCKLLWE